MASCRNIITVALAITCAAIARAQTPAWPVVSSAGADLWFHGVATVALGGPGRLPLSDSADVSRVRSAKATLGVRTALDSAAPSLGAALRADPAFEVLHFVPPYFSRSNPAAMLAAVRRVADGGAGTSGFGVDERFGATALSAALPTAGQRRVLRDLVVALQDEWTRFYRGYRMNAIRPEALAEALNTWGPLVGALRPYLVWAGLDGGQLMVSPALGPDGRFFEGAPDLRDDNVVAVWLPPDHPADAAYFAVRELCYPAVRRALPEGAMPADRADAENLSGRAAVWCGEMLLRRFASDRVAAYREAWMRAVGERGTFEDAFAVPAEVTRALERTLHF